jgi:hypothetical protein
MPLSHGGKYYRAHRARELERKQAERARKKSAFVAYDRATLESGDPRTEAQRRRDFNRLYKERGWLVGSHSPKRPPTREEAQRQRRFYEEALGRDYTDAEFDIRYGGR